MEITQFVFLSLSLFATFNLIFILGILFRNKYSLKNIEYYKLYILLFILLVDSVNSGLHFFGIISANVEDISSVITLIILIVGYFWYKDIVNKYYYLVYAILSFSIISFKMLGFYESGSIIIFTIRSLVYLIIILMFTFLYLKIIINDRKYN